MSRASCVLLHEEIFTNCSLSFKFPCWEWLSYVVTCVWSCWELYKDPSIFFVGRPEGPQSLFSVACLFIVLNNSDRLLYWKRNLCSKDRLPQLLIIYCTHLLIEFFFSIWVNYSSLCNFGAVGAFCYELMWLFLVCSERGEFCLFSFRIQMLYEPLHATLKRGHNFPDVKKCELKRSSIL